MALHQHSARPSTTSAQGLVPSGESARPGPGRFLLTGDAVVGTNVVNRVGEDYGKIESVVFDVDRGCIAYAVLAYGGWSGFGLRFYAIPWKALEIDWDRKCFVLDIDRDRLRSAPGFEQGHWPAMEDEQWARDLHAVYGLPPYWETH